MKTTELKPQYCDTIPKDLDEGILYISKAFSIAIHLCACGCKGKTVTPLGDNKWILTETNDGKITLRPSIGNWSGENPYHAHYLITENKIQFV